MRHSGRRRIPALAGHCPRVSVSVLLLHRRPMDGQDRGLGVQQAGARAGTAGLAPLAGGQQRTVRRGPNGRRVLLHEPGAPTVVARRQPQSAVGRLQLCHPHDRDLQPQAALLATARHDETERDTVGGESSATLHADVMNCVKQTYDDV